MSDDGGDYVISKSVFYVMHTGYRALLPIVEIRAIEMVHTLERFSLYTQVAIEWMDLVSAIFILVVHMLLAVVVQMIQENKVRVLSLYSEVRVSHVKDSLLKCTDYFQFISLINRTAHHFE